MFSGKVESGEAVKGAVIILLSFPNLFASPQFGKYILDIPGSETDWSEASPLIERLEQEVFLFVREGPFAPLLFDTGKPHPVFEFADPTDTLYPLSIALPFLPKRKASELRTFLKKEVRRFNPLTNRHYPLFQGKRREFAPLGKRPLDWLSGKILSKGGARRVKPKISCLRDPGGRLYALWAYAYYTGDWDFLKQNWENIRLAAEAARRRNPRKAENAKVASLIAYARICRKLKRPEAAKAFEEACSALKQSCLLYTSPSPRD